MSYRYDPGTRAYVAQLLFGAVPAYFRVADESPAGRNELRDFLEVLAAPLAIARQNIEELHGNLFIDTADDWVLRHLAEMVGTILIFPDADSNRRDIRSTVALRRRKGTPLMLEELGETLTGQMVVTQEGWKLVQMTQDLNLPRRERIVPDVRDAILAETESGPLCATHHLVDIRAIARTTGIFHPLHVAHWAHPTLLFPLEEGFPADLRDPLTDPDLRFAFHPLGEFQPLRAGRPSSSDREVKTDRVPPMHFDRWPERWFNRPRRFSVKIGGIAAAVAASTEQGRIVSNRVAGAELADGSVAITLLEHDPRRFHGPVRLEVAAVALAAGVPDTANAAAVQVRSQIELSAAGAANFVVVNAGAVDPARIVMLRLQPVGAAAPFFPGAVVEIASDVDAAVLATEEAEYARQGFLRGALIVRVPPTRVEGDRWFVVTRDGSCFEAQSTGAGAADIPVTTPSPGVSVVPRDRLLTPGPGSAWPPTLPAADPDAATRIPNAPGRGPIVLHGGRVLVPAGPGFADIGAAQSCALVFALRVGVAVPQYRPFLRLAWTGPSPAAATWTAIDDAAALAPLNPRLEEIAELRQERLDEARCLVRFECQQVDARLAPAEVAWPGHDGASILVYLPEMTAAAANPIPPWPPGPGIGGVSQAAGVAADGSTWDEMFGANLRQAQGQIAPLAEYATVRRRVVRYRRLCAWRNEVPPLQMLPATAAGNLDIDVEHGLFSLAGTEAIRPYPVGPEGAPVPPGVTVTYQDGYTDRTGARPDSREPLIDRRLATPTRIVSASGRLHDAAPSTWFAIPRYRTLGAALAAIAAAPQATEVVQFEDSATYRAETLTWPAGVTTLTVQAAERERPTVIVASWAVAATASYDDLEILGVSWSADADGVYVFPPAAHIGLRYSSILREGMRLRFDLTGAAEEDVVDVVRCVTAGLELIGAGVLRIADSVIDAGQAVAAVAMTAVDGEIRVDRSTVFGAVNCRVIQASESIFSRTVTVTDRFRGCVRYSRVTGDSVLPRIHRIAEDVDVRFVSTGFDRHSAAHARLAPDADRRVLAGAEDGGEMGAFHEFRLALRYEGYRRRLEESTPAGLMTGIIRLD